MQSRFRFYWIHSEKTSRISQRPTRTVVLLSSRTGYMATYSMPILLLHNILDNAAVFYTLVSRRTARIYRWITYILVGRIALYVSALSYRLKKRVAVNSVAAWSIFEHILLDLRFVGLTALRRVIVKGETIPTLNCTSRPICQFLQSTRIKARFANVGVSCKCDQTWREKTDQGISSS
jgi:hypothetical protein